MLRLHLVSFLRPENRREQKGGRVLLRERDALISHDAQHAVGAHADSIVSIGAVRDCEAFRQSKREGWHQGTQLA